MLGEDLTFESFKKAWRIAGLHTIYLSFHEDETNRVELRREVVNGMYELLLGMIVCGFILSTSSPSFFLSLSSTLSQVASS